MKKYLIIWFIILFVVKCSGTKEEIKVDPLRNSYKVNDVLLDKSIIKDDLNYFLKKYKRDWSDQTKEKFITIIYSGSKEFNIDPKVVMSIISIESKYNIRAKGKNKKSVDWGLSQQNSKYIKQRYKATEKYLKDYKIKYNVKDKYDMACNIFSCYMYMRDLTDYADLIQFSDLILAYNQGVKGALRNNNNKYYELFLKEYMEI